MKTITQTIIAALTMAVIAMIFGFTMINLTLNCQSWDSERWTIESSCVTPAQFFEVLK